MCKAANASLLRVQRFCYTKREQFSASLRQPAQASKQPRGPKFVLKLGDKCELVHYEHVGRILEISAATRKLQGIQALPHGCFSRFQFLTRPTYPSPLQRERGG